MNSEESINIDAEPEVEVSNKIDEMSDEEFDAMYDGEEVDGDTEEVAVDESEVDYDALYKSQMDDTDALLDKPVLLKVNGEVMKVDNIVDLKNLAEKGAGSAKAFQAIAGDVKTIEFMKDNGLSLDDLSKLVEGEPHVREEPNTNEVAVNKLIEQIESSPISDDFLSGIEMLPNDVVQMIGKDPDLLADLANEFDGGYAQKIMPHIKQEMAIKGLDFADAYQSIGRRMMKRDENADKSKVLTKMPKPTIGSRRGEMTQNDIDSMSEEAFTKYFDSL